MASYARLSRNSDNSGFTLIEMAMVIVIIGLIVGGILVGRDMISAAEVRAQVSQIEKYNTAANVFREKYNAMPGDLTASTANAFGFAARGNVKGQGDGNGILEGNCTGNNPASNSGIVQSAGETPLFWVDLSRAGLIDGTFNTATANAVNCTANITGSALDNWFPRAKIGRGYVTVTGGTGGGVGYMSFSLAGPNFFLIHSFDVLGTGFGAGTPNVTGYSFTVQQAWNIDTKIDDGMPTSGRLLTLYQDNAVTWANAQGPPTNNPMGVLTTRCYQNGGVPGATMQYNLTYGSYVACSLAFQFQ